MIRTRFAPSPTGYMHIGNLRTALYEFLIAKNKNGEFILRIEDTDQSRLVSGALDTIYNTLKIANLKHDEGPDVGGDYGPYVQSERRDIYFPYALQLIEEKKAYYCFCTKERLEGLQKKGASEADIFEYDRHCLNLSTEEIEKNLKEKTPYVIRQLIPEGSTTFTDLVYGNITVDNSELDDQILIKSDGFPTYNFANVIDDNLMKITHVIRGNEYLSSTPKYNILYKAFGWEIPTYMHLPLILNENGEKLSKRKGDSSFEDLLELDFLPEAIINYIALLGWAPKNDNEFFTLAELIEAFDGTGIGKSPSIFDTKKLSWMNSEYIKKMNPDLFFEKYKNILQSAIKNPNINLKEVSEMVKTRIDLPKDIYNLVDFIDNLPNYSTDLFENSKMKSDLLSSKISLENLITPILDFDFSNEENNFFSVVKQLAEKLEVKNNTIVWPLQVALSGKETSPTGATQLISLLGKEESVNRIKIALEKLS